jgi:formylglycine-generating enzyme required for sulfatase activity
MGREGGPATEAPAREVTLSEYYLARSEITSLQYAASRPAPQGKPAGDGAKLPRVNVSWHDAVRFCEWLSTRDERKAVYRLPTEAEWEFAAAGAGGREYPWGDGEPGHERGNIAGDADGFAGLAPAGSYAAGATPEGLLDLAGNAAEWCHDWFARYPDEAERDPTGTDNGTLRVIRGGAFCFEAKAARSGARMGRRPDHPGDFIGFRVVRELGDDERAFLRAASDGR